MQTAEFNYKDFSTGREQEVDEQLLVRFFFKPRKDEEQSLTQGRPIFKEVEYVEIRIPGSRTVQASRPATPRDKQRFPRHYGAFKNRVELPEEGTPLSEWPQINRSQVEELTFVNVKTVEQLASMSDTNITQFQGGYTLRTRAKEWLEKAGDTKLIAEKEALEKRIHDLEAKIDLLLTQPETEELASDPEAAHEEPKTQSRRRRTKPAPE